MPPRSPSSAALRLWNARSPSFSTPVYRSIANSGALAAIVSPSSISPRFFSHRSPWSSRVCTHHSHLLSIRAPFSTRTAAMASIERITENLDKPELDDRSYRVIRLPNKLEALLVHDPDTDKASAAVNVNVGNFSDADDMPGMAHAVEHLLFMGTEKVG